MSIIKNRRLGRFRIAVDFINDDPVGCRALFGNVIVLRSDAILHNGCIEYLAICDGFGEVQEGGNVPLYNPTFKVYYDEAGNPTGSKLVGWGPGFF